jgi:hypothetical protein
MIEENKFRAIGYVGTLSEFTDTRDRMIRGGWKIKTLEYGQTAKILIHNNGNKYTFFGDDQTRKGMRGGSIVTNLKRDIDSYISRNGLPSFKPNQSLIKSNVDAIIENRDDLWTHQDINACYWQAAINLNYISTKNYLTGKDFKEAINAAIGSLAKIVTQTSYESNKEKSREVYRPEARHESIYWSIVNYVNDCMNEIMNLGNGCIAWITDCIVYNLHHPSIYSTLKGGDTEIDRIMTKYGFTWKRRIAHLESISLDRVTFICEGEERSILIPFNKRQQFKPYITHE